MKVQLFKRQESDAPEPGASLSSVYSLLFRNSLGEQVLFLVRLRSGKSGRPGYFPLLAEVAVRAAYAGAEVISAGGEVAAVGAAVVCLDVIESQDKPRGVNH